MSIEKVKAYFAAIGEPERVIEFEQSTFTSELAAQALGCEVGRIAKTISVFVDKKPVLILMSGDMKIDNKKFKAQFNCRPHMAECVRSPSTRASRFTLTRRLNVST